RLPRPHPPPTTTLFPYTTLFRSGRKGRAARQSRSPRQQRRAGGAEAARLRRQGRLPALAGARLPQGRTGEEPVADGRPDQAFFTDRKSTRLNSSHVAISYAVFCL